MSSTLKDLSSNPIFETISPCFNFDELKRFLLLNKEYRKIFKSQVQKNYIKHCTFYQVENSIGCSPRCDDDIHSLKKISDSFPKEEITNFALRRSYLKNIEVPKNIKTFISNDPFQCRDGFEKIQGLPHLTTMSLTIFKLDLFDEFSLVPRTLTKLHLNFYVNEEMNLDFRPFVNLNVLEVISCCRNMKRNVVYLPGSLDALKVDLENTEFFGDVSLVCYEELGDYEGRLENVYHGKMFCQYVRLEYLNGDYIFLGDYLKQYGL